MTVPQLVQRMAEWLRADYEAAIVEDRGTIVGYALFRREEEYVYMRHLVRAENRRRGIGRSLIQWLLQNALRAAHASASTCWSGMKRGGFWNPSGFRRIA